MPQQDLATASGQREHALHSPFVGAPTSAGPVDLASLVDQKDDLIERLRGATYLDVAAAHGFEIRRGHARFACPELLLVDGEPLPARAYVVATGSVPLTPELPGLDDVDWLTSMTAMELTTLPESLIVIGGGYVGMEQAQLFAGLGTRVTLVGRLAPHAEPELRDVLRRAFERSGITLVEERASAVAASGGLGQDRNGSRVRCNSFDEGGAQLCPCGIATVTPQHFTVASQANIHMPTREFPTRSPPGWVRTAPGPYPPDWSR